MPLKDTFRVVNGDNADGKTFPGKRGKIDFVMVDSGARVTKAWISRDWSKLNKASDHWPVAAVVQL